MECETKQYGNILERLGRQVLVQLSDLPESALHWPLPLPEGASPFTHALRLVEESAFWVLEVIGAQYRLYHQGVEERTGGTFADLALRYERWFTALHQVLDMLPDASLGLPVDVPFPHQNVFGGGTTTIRACLLHAVGQSAVRVGYIQFIRQLYADGERVLHEVSDQADDSLIVAVESGD